MAAQFTVQSNLEPSRLCGMAGSWAIPFAITGNDVSSPALALAQMFLRLDNACVQYYPLVWVLFVFGA